MTERIAAAAVKHLGKVYTLPPPARHHHLIKLAYDETGQPIMPGEQGFLTDTGRFVDRKRALRIALASGQMTKDPHPIGLFSEDLW